MKKYDVTDEVIIEASAELVYKAVIACYEGTNNWWMPYLSSKLLKGNSGSEIGALYKVTIHGIPQVSFITETLEVHINEIIRVKYIKGAFEGEGLWEFKTTGNKTILTFRWTVSPKVLPLQIISFFYPLNKSHSAVMQKGFENLKKVLEQN